MSIKALQDYTYYAKYARYNKEKQRRETWLEAVKRVEDMHLRRYPQIEEHIKWAFDFVRECKVLGSQRALQFGGAPIEKNHMRLYNCATSFCDRIRFFQECLWALLCGSGVGFSVQKYHIDQLPPFSPLVNTKGEKEYIIDDSIEGWSDALGVLMASYLQHPEFPEWEGYDVQFNYSAIRPAGSYISSGSGKAPGHEPLKKALDIIQSLLNNRSLRYDKLRPIDAYDIIMHASDAVLSGGVRRSSTIALFSPDDQEMLNAKTGDWFVKNPQRARSNNSALLIRGETTKEDFLKLFKSVKEYGEPGFIWGDDIGSIFNPCLTKDSLIATSNGLKTIEELIGVPFTALVNGECHPSAGFWKTGNKEVMELEFNSGRTIVLTPNHQVMTTLGWKKAGEIAVGEEVVIHNHRSHALEIDTKSQDHATGYLLGSFLGDGNINLKSAQLKWWGQDKEIYRKDAFELLKQSKMLSKKHKSDSNTQSICECISSVQLFNLAKSLGCIKNNNRQLHYKAISGNASYLSGLIAGYFDADGTVAVNHKKGCSLRIASKQLDNLKNLQIALNYLGIYSKIYKNRHKEGYKNLPDGHGGNKPYFCQSNHELIITCDNIIIFNNLIHLRNKDKSTKVQAIVDGYQRSVNKTTFVDTLLSKKCLRHEDVYDCNVNTVHAFDSNSVYVHNCGEVNMLPRHWITKESGFQMCNLTEINGKKIKNKQTFLDAAKAASIIGTIQAGYTDFAYLGKVTEEIVRHEALLGVSITGMMDNPDVLFNPNNQQEAAQLVLETNAWIADLIGINKAARTTCIKPSGTAALVCGSASGIHPHHARRYFRRVQGNNLEDILQYFKTINPQAVDKSCWSANKTDEVITFCVEVPDGAKIKNDLSAVEFLEYVKLTQNNWVKYGKVTELCTEPWLENNVSNTCSVKPDEWDDVAKFIYDNKEYFAGISLLPHSGDLDYVQAPMCKVHTPREILKIYGNCSLMASGLIVDAIHAFGDNLWYACDAALNLRDTIGVEQEDWVRRVKQFSKRYLENDVRKCTYLLKEVHNWKSWLDLNREYKDVDYTLLHEDTDNTKPMEAIACAGGACELSFN